MLDWKRALRYTELQYILIPFFFFPLLLSQGYFRKKVGGREHNRKQGNKASELK